MNRAPEIELWILLCTVAFFWLVILLRCNRLSLGLPIAYLFSLLLIHVPGAFVQLVTDQFAYDAEPVEIGIHFTAIGALCFALGVQIACYLNADTSIYPYVQRRKFWYFCLIGGLVVQFGLGALYNLPSIRATLDRGSGVWMLGALLGLRFALSSGNILEVAIWSTAALIPPILIFLLAGFLSYGSAALIVVAGALVISVRSRSKLIIATALGTFVGLTIFVNYFAHRVEFRQIAWSGASMDERISAAAQVFSSFEWLDPSNEKQLFALDQRLNQNYFVGLAAKRIEQEQVSYLYGRSIWEAVIALVPRALWPDKPVFGGSGTIVADMTGLKLEEDRTSWGVGNVMEFQINFGTPGVMVGFLILGYLLGLLDYKAASAEARGDLGKLILFFLVSVALIQPGSSLVEMAGGSAAAVVAAYVWNWLWQIWSRRSKRAASREFAAAR